MYIDINNNSVKVNIIRKKSNKNTYLRVKEDLEMYVTTNIFTSDKDIEKIIIDNYPSIKRMYEKQSRMVATKNKLTFFGNELSIIYTTNNTEIINNHLYLNKKDDIDKFLKKEAFKIFKEHLDYWYNMYKYEIPYPKLKIRKMKSRWGVCNYVKKTVTLNLELIKYKSEWLDYVIVHELSHFIYQNHSKNFWNIVSENYPNYKKVRLEMKKQ